MKAVIHGFTAVNQPVHIPASKSLSHRALIAASLTPGDSLIHHLVDNRDTEATMRGMGLLGAEFKQTDDGMIVRGMEKDKYDGSVIDCGESGSTLRFLIPLAALSGKEAVFTGHGRLMERPQKVYEDLFREKGLKFEKKDNCLYVQGPLRGGEYVIDGSISSQFITGLLYALPLCDEDSTILVKEPYESRSYVGLTLDVLHSAGIRIICEGNTYHVPGRQTYALKEYTVAGDDSQLAFFAARGMTAIEPVTCLDVNHDSRQGDRIMLEYIRKMGGRIEEIPHGFRFYPSALKGTDMDLQDCPDLGPVLFALAARAEGTSVFHHVKRLRIKESDRIACMEEELAKLGVIMESDEDTAWVHGVSGIRSGAVLDGHNDHRIVMALSVLASSDDVSVTIAGAEAVNKSYPGFFRDLEKTGVKVDYDNI